MPIDLVALATILLLMRPSAILLSVWMGVCGCGWLSYSSGLRMGAAVLAFKNNAPSSASDAYDIMLRAIVDMLRTAPLPGGFYLSFDGNFLDSCEIACIIFLQVRCIVMYCQ